MKRASHLNLKWTVRDTDHILRMAQEGLDATEIARRFTKAGKSCCGREIANICDGAGVEVRRREA